MQLITIVIIGVTVLLSLNAFNNYALFERYKFQPQAILKGREFDRLLTSGFLHVDMTHLLFNMLTLFFFAGVVIQFFSLVVGNASIGAVIFAIVYLASIIGGNLLALLFQRNNYRYSAVGASGGVSGILFASIVIYPDLQLYLFFAIPMKGWFFALLYLGYSIYGMRKQLGNIGHEAHLGGALVGLIAPLFFKPDLIFNQVNLLGFPMPLFALLLLPIVVLFAMALKESKN